jgi:glyoxylate/hydroxypyruvate reductase A
MTGGAAGREPRILMHVGGEDAGDWHRGLAAALPEATIAVWPEPAPDAEYLVLWRPPPELFAAAPAARAIFNLGAGVDAMLEVPTLPADVPVIRLEDAGMAEQMADYVTLAVLAAYREQRVYAQQQQAARWERRPYRPKRDFRVGILGLGVLGGIVAAALSRHGFPLAGWSRGRKAIPGVQAFAGRAELPAFLSVTRMLVCLLPSTPETRGLLDRDALACLPRGAHLVNVARGALVVDADLLAALDAGHIESATLDVFHAEPLPASHPFWHHPRVAITPHASAITLIDESTAQIAAKIRRLRQGLPVTGVVDRAYGY